MSDRELVRRVCHETATLHAQVGTTCADAIVAAAGVVGDALVAGRKVLVFGNGGSAADSQHFVAELVGQFSRRVERRGLPAIALTSDLAVMTAVANDFGFAAVFARQLDALGVAGDVALAITTSGTSANVNEGLRSASRRALRTVALTGRDGGESGRLAEVHVNVAHDNPQRVQEVQQTILHLICELVERRLDGQPAAEA
ncbi:MAG: SIS domain-containing protein [Acidobacteriota bacterium]